MEEELKVAVLLTFHNRKEKTLASLRAIYQAALLGDIALTAIVVDDGSTDGTSSEIRQLFPDIEILEGDGNLFWNRGMHRAFSHALSRSFEFYLWLNDDTCLYPHALTHLFNTYCGLAKQSGANIVVVGATRDSQGNLTYGGGIGKSRIRRFHYSKIWDEEIPLECDVMNGNCVLIPQCVAAKVGNLDPAFEHAMGDTDYALRVRKSGGKVYVASGFVGECSGNSQLGTYVDRSRSLRDRWTHMISPKGLPPRSWCHFTRKHGGFLWPIYFIWPYLKLLAR